MKACDFLGPSHRTSFSFARRYQALGRLEIRRTSPFPGEPSWTLAVFSDPGGTRTTRPPYGGRARPPTWQRLRLPAGEAISGLDSTALALAVYASPGRLPEARRKTRFPLRARLCGAGLVTRRVPPKGFWFPFPPSQAYPDTMPTGHHAISPGCPGGPDSANPPNPGESHAHRLTAGNSPGMELAKRTSRPTAAARTSAIEPCPRIHRVYRRISAPTGLGGETSSRCVPLGRLARNLASTFSERNSKYLKPLRANPRRAGQPASERGRPSFSRILGRFSPNCSSPYVGPSAIIAGVGAAKWM